MPQPVVLDARVVTGSGGGPDKTILNSPRFLAPLGYRNVCAYLHPPADPGYEVIRQKAAKYQAPLVSIPDRGPWDWRVVTELLRVCRREKVAIWHGHDYKTNALGLLLRRFHRMHLVTTLHGWVHHTTRTPLYYKVDKWCLPRYERVIGVSEDLVQAGLSCGVRPDRSLLIENGIDTDEYTRRQSVPEARAKVGLAAGGWLVGAVGRLEKEKGFDLLVRAVGTLVAGGSDVRLVVVGEGGERAALEKLAAELGVADRVSLPGWQSDVRGYFEAMDVFALSSHREGLPNVVLEAMALEVPVVATAVNGVPKLIEDGSSGALVPAGDAGALADALGRVLADTALRDRYRAAARRTAETRYSFEARMAKMKRVYDEVLG